MDGSDGGREWGVSVSFWWNFTKKECISLLLHKAYKYFNHK